MNFVDNINLVPRIGRLVTYPVQNLANVVNAGAGRRVKLHHVNMPPGSNRLAVFTHAAGTDCRAALTVFSGTVESFGNNPRSRRFADTANTGQNISMMQAVVFDGIG